MATAALKLGHDLLEASPSFPIMPAPGDRFRETVKTVVGRFGKDVASWRAKLLASHSELRKSLEELIRLSDDPSYAIRQLEELIGQAEATIALRRKSLAELTEAFNSETAQIAAVSTEEARFWRKMTRRFLDLASEELEDRLAFHTFLQTLLWDYDPDAHGGQSFETVEDLITDLHRTTR